MEASTESEWVARCLEEMGHEAAGRTTSKLVPGGNHVETFTRAAEVLPFALPFIDAK